MQRFAHLVGVLLGGWRVRAVPSSRGSPTNERARGDVLKRRITILGDYLKPPYLRWCGDSRDRCAYLSPEWINRSCARQRGGVGGTMMGLD